MGTTLFKLINYKVESQFMNKKSAQTLKKFIYFPNTMYSTVLTYIHQYKNYSQHLGQRSKVTGFKGGQRQNYSLEIIIPLLSLLLTPQ